MFPKKKKKKDRYTSAKSTYPFVSSLSTPPLISSQGRLFPVLGIEIKKGYKFIVLRDAWGLVPNVPAGLRLSSSPVSLIRTHLFQNQMPSMDSVASSRSRKISLVSLCQPLLSPSPP
jgi:hypothetical protein